MAPSGYIPPPFAAVDDTGYHVKGQLTHTHSIHNWDLYSSKFLMGNYAYSSQPIFHGLVWGGVTFLFSFVL